MKHLLPLIFLSCASMKENHVYICKSATAVKYHYSETCDGLNNCRHEVHQVSVDEAAKIGYTLCDLEK